MRYVIFRDDDVNALTPSEHLERLYRPILDRGWPVNLAAIPSVATTTRKANGELEGHGLIRTARRASWPSAQTTASCSIFKANPGYHVVQHGCRHDFLEFTRMGRAELAQRLERGSELLVEAGFPKPYTFIPPYDRISAGGTD